MEIDGERDGDTEDGEGVGVLKKIAKLLSAKRALRVVPERFGTGQFIGDFPCEN